MARFNGPIAIAACALVVGCVSQPSGPTVAVFPAPNKPFSVFEEDQAVCKQYAVEQIGGSAGQARSEQLETAAVGTLLGAGLGAAVGGGQGAGIGAGAGAVAGTAVGAGRAQGARWSLQKRYNIAYEQCMYAKGNQVPGFPVRPAAPPPPPPGEQPES